MLCYGLFKMILSVQKYRHYSFSNLHFRNWSSEKLMTFPRSTDISGWSQGQKPNPQFPGLELCFITSHSLWCPYKTTRSLQPQQLSEENLYQPQEVALGKEEGVTRLWLRADQSPGRQGNPPFRWGNKPHPWLFVWTLRRIPLVPSSRILLWPKIVTWGWSKVLFWEFSLDTFFLTSWPASVSQPCTLCDVSLCPGGGNPSRILMLFSLRACSVPGIMPSSSHGLPHWVLITGCGVGAIITFTLQMRKPRHRESG